MSGHPPCLLSWTLKSSWSATPSHAANCSHGAVYRGGRFLSTTTATTFSLVGSLNKIPVALIGLVAFKVPWSVENLASIAVGLLAGIVFVVAKRPPSQPAGSK